ncbi:transcription antitermination factor NusB [Heyndrickxia sp. NPDC080065]|uniref:transcription antitermination factor NusB n=1 Tax=Heyndrickxia sp. NPDC080065 TaxID=3390568 RepID=UPI003CFE5D52
MKRRTAREKALQALFQIDINEVSPEEAIKNTLKNDESDDYLNSLVNGTYLHMKDIDETISKYLEKWTIERLAKVDLNILRLGVYELIYVDEVPANVAINEALEVSKRFADDQSTKFINGVLSKIKDNIAK